MRQKPNKPKIIITAPILTQSGYMFHARFVYRALQAIEKDIDLFIIPLPWGTCSWVWQDDEERKKIDSLINKTILYTQKMNGSPQFDVHIHVGILNEFKRMAPKAICVTAGIETDRVSRNWLAKSHEVDKIIVPSEFSKSGFVDTVYEMVHPQTQQKMELCCGSPVDVVQYPCRIFEKDERFKLDLKHEFNFLNVSQWSPRKNIEAVIKTFIEKFHDKEVGLILKSGMRNDSIIDREYTEERVSEFISHIKKDLGIEGALICEVILLHGYLTDEELSALYQHPKIKAYVSMAHGEGFCGLDYTPIITQTGIKRLDNMQVGDLVLTHTNSFKPVTSVMKREYSGKMIKIVPYFAQNIDPIVLTPNHRVYVFNKTTNTFGWKSAGDLSMMDVLCLPKSKFKASIIKLDLWKFVAGSNNLVLTENDTYIDYKLGNKKGLKIKRTVNVTPSLGKLLGYFLSEGSATKTGSIAFSLHQDEEHTLAEEIIDCMLDVFGVKLSSIRTFKNKKAINVMFDSKIVSSFLRNFCGVGAKNKYINETIFLMPVDVIKNVITSFVNGDGCVTSNGNVRTVEMQVSNSYMMRSFRLLLQSFGIISNFSSYNKKGIIKNKWKYDSDVESLKVTRIDSSNKLMQLLNENHAFNTHFLNEVSEKRIARTNPKTILQDDMFLLQMKSLDVVQHEGMVYNISVEDDESYCTENFVVHNCLPAFEASYYGIPIIAPYWSGYVDFVNVPTKDKKSGRTRLKSMISEVEYKIAPVQKNVLWKDILEPDMQWCYPNLDHLGLIMEDIFKNNGKYASVYKSRANKLKKQNREVFSIETQYEKMLDSLDVFGDNDSTSKVENTSVEESDFISM